MRRKDKMTALLLALFLGGLGIHRFYLDDTGMGILYILTGGLCGIGVIVDVINIAFMSDEMFDARYNNIRY